MSIYGATGRVVENTTAMQTNSNLYQKDFLFQVKLDLGEEGKNQSVESKIATSKDSAKKLSEVWKKATDLSDKVTDLSEDSEDLEELLEKTRRFVKSYNAVLESVKEVSSLSLKREAQKLVEDTKANAGSFAKIGISITNSGSLEMDKKEFKKADTDTIKDLFTSESAEQLGEKAVTVKETSKREMLKANTYNRAGAYSFNYNHAVECFA